ncbi:GntR family transcriptional regulator [Undibacter mobilis]|uniref:GntR family transcriptional regulator n=1 Tax=Undibacter mobilis TaxID=2292256 RepID=A0A371B859_9BRAD|nr:GntR family transcriptional regulator [Undibacter mobilis]RDV03779.1 GntR family transcriptional regulator [Undibacter mobilis]
MDDAANQQHKRTPDEEIAEALESDIIFGRLKPGERLREEALLERFGHSRHFIRLAFARLEKKGILVHTRNVGAAVRAFTVAEVEEIYDVREMIQRQAALRIRLPAEPEAVARIAAIQRDYASCVTTGDLRGIHACNDRFHLAIFALCNNGYLLALVKQYMDLTYVIRTVTFSDPKALEASRIQHELMIEQLKGRDNWALAELCVQHLRPNKEKYLGRLREAAEIASHKPAAE